MITIDSKVFKKIVGWFEYPEGIDGEQDKVYFYKIYKSNKYYLVFQDENPFFFDESGEPVNMSSFMWNRDKGEFEHLELCVIPDKYKTHENYIIDHLEDELPENIRSKISESSLMGISVVLSYFYKYYTSEELIDIAKNLISIVENEFGKENVKYAVLRDNAEVKKYINDLCKE